jgi:hypothetical protein
MRATAPVLFPFPHGWREMPFKAFRKRQPFDHASPEIIARDAG